MRKLYQLDTTARLPVLVFDFMAADDSMPFFCVEVEPPAKEDGKILWWETLLDSVADHEYGRAGTGNWILKDDNRSQELFLTMDGSRYSIGGESAVGQYNGIGDIPSWLTTKERPSLYHSWSGIDWEVTPESELQRLADLSASVRQQRDALIAQTDWTQLDDSPFKGDATWLSYRQELRDITEQPGFPEVIIWPTAPNS